MKEFLIKCGIFVAVLGVVVLPIFWLFWLLWCWVLPQIWPTGPQGFISPGFWLFLGVSTLLSFIGGHFGGRK